MSVAEPTLEKPERVRCGECRHYVGGEWRHAIECSHDTRTLEEKVEYYRRQAESARDTYKRLQTHFVRQCEQVVFWQGKFRMVKHENNVLRRKVTKQGAAPAALVDLLADPPLIK